MQIGSDGKRSEGKLYSQAPAACVSNMRCRRRSNSSPTAPGSWCATSSSRLQDIYAIDQTPLKFLLKEKIDFEHDVTVLDVTTDDNGVAISLEDKATFGGTSHLKLIFDPKTFKLRQWQITDPQGYETLLSLFNIDQKRTPDPALFKIDVNAKSGMTSSANSSKLAERSNDDEEKQWPLFRSFQGVRLGAFRFDLVAGLTLAAIAIPEQMATARLGGFPPHIGFFAFIAGSIAFAAFGSNRFLSSGTDSTITPIFAGALAALATVGGTDYGELAAVLALLVGLFLLLASMFGRAGSPISSPFPS